MTDEPMESGQEPGAGELPKPKYQEAADEQPSAVAKADEISEELRKIIREEAERAAQSTKDKRFDKVERTYGDLTEIQQMLEAVKGGQDPKELLEALELKNLRDKVTKLEQSLSQPSTIPGKSDADEAYAKAKGIVSKAGLNNNPRILGIMEGTYKSPSEMLETLNLAVLDEVAGKPRATDASKVTPSSGRSPQAAEKGTAEFDALLDVSEADQINLQAIIDAAKQVED